MYLVTYYSDCFKGKQFAEFKMKSKAIEFAKAKQACNGITQVKLYYTADPIKF